MFYGEKNLVGADAKGYKSLRNSFSRFDKLANHNADTVERFSFAGPLLPAARKAKTGDAETFPGLAENDPIVAMKTVLRLFLSAAWSGACGLAHQGRSLRCDG